jgi:hypothetical protein
VITLRQGLLLCAVVTAHAQWRLGCGAWPLMTKVNICTRTHLLHMDVWDGAQCSKQLSFIQQQPTCPEASPVQISTSTTHGLS